jgi:hypothetical protein
MKKFTRFFWEKFQKNLSKKKPEVFPKIDFGKFLSKNP